MTISDTATKFRYEGNGVTNTFAFSGKAFTAADLVVQIITRATDALVETLTLTTDYSVTIATNGTASIVVTNAAKIPSSLQDIQIRRSLAKTQTTVLPTGTKFPAKAVEAAIDRAIGIVQDLNESVSRSLKFPVTSSTTVATLPEPEDDKVLCFDGTTGLIKSGATNTSLASGATTATAQAVIATTQAGIATAQAIIATTKAAEAEVFRDEVEVFRDEAEGFATGSVLLMTEQGSTPSTPTSGVSKLYFKTDGQLYALDDAGDEFRVGSCNRIYAALHSSPKSWELPCNGSTVAKTSGATYNGTKYKRAFFYLWDEVDDIEAPVVTGRGVSAQADWDANKRITVPDMRDYVIVGISVAGSITTVAAKAGASTVSSTGSIAINLVTLSEANLPPHKHLQSIPVPNSTPYTDYGSTGSGTQRFSPGVLSSVYANTSSVGSGSSFTPTGTFTGSASSVLQKSFGAYFYLEI